MSFGYPHNSIKEVIGSTCIFIALHRSMIRLKWLTLVYYRTSKGFCLFFLCVQFCSCIFWKLIASSISWSGCTAHEEVTDSGGQIEPPGMHMIYLPYSDDIRPIEEARWFIKL
uniref:Uncharacterized protein n=1 Tax=Lactuca sativa TaxID=4236 RepID=A0A9R1VUG5_LACSA|nr:hypothetical protein LSAT_V11C400184710 [Lactuca sativa]